MVASRIGGLPEVIEHGRDGFLHAVDDLDGMARSAVALLTDPGLNQRIGDAARHTVKAKFCADKIVPRYEAYYEETLALRHRGPV